MSDVIYLDAAASTPLDPRVLDAMMPFLSERYGNPSSVHRKGREAKAALEQARAHIAALVGANPAEIILTSGGTEANNLALHIALDADALAAPDARRHIVTSAAEHEAILKPCHWYAQHGYHVTFLEPGHYGTVSAEAVADALRDDTALVTLMHANNETGSLNPIHDIATIAHERGVLFHSDAVQSAGKAPLDAAETPLDFASLSAHKLHGPKGAGALYARAGRDIPPAIRGGAQERGRRGGTENIPAIVGFGEAARLALLEHEERSQTWQALGLLFRERTAALFPGAIINTAPGTTETGGAETGGAVPTIMSISFPFDGFGMDGEALLLNMDLDGVALSSGSACTAGSVEPSHVMLALGHELGTAKATLRFSFGKDSTPDQLHTALATLHAVVGRIRRSGS